MRPFTAALLAAALALGACSDRDDGGTDLAPPDADVTGADGDDGGVAPPSGDGDRTGDATAGDSGDGGGAAPSGDDDDGAASDGDDGGVDPPLGGTDGGGDAPDPLDDPDDGLELLRPAVAPGSPAARLIAGLHRAVGAAVLDLDARLATGAPLSALQSDCLAGHDVALGQPVLGLDCPRAYAFEESGRVRVLRAAFTATASCAASVRGGTIDDCFLAFAEVMVPTEFVAPEPPARRPIPVVGADIRYAIDGPTLLVTNVDGDDTVGPFRCEIDLESGDEVLGDGGEDCVAVIGRTADRIDALLPP